MNAQEWFVLPGRDEAWQKEAWRETVRAVVVTEQRAYIANLLGIAAVAAAASYLHNASDFIFPLVMRVLAAVGTHLAYRHVRHLLEANRPIEPSLRLLTTMLFFGGMSWAFLLIPLVTDPVINPARGLIGAGTMVAVALIITMTVPLRIPTYAFCTGFILTLFGGLAFAPANLGLGVAVGTTALTGLVMIFAFASSRQRELAADMLVENRRLSEELADALAHAEFLAAHDPLTGLYNRRALFERGLVDRATRDRSHMFVVDLDNFKQLNDKFGHDMGDRVLLATGLMLRDALRAYAEGEHFAVRLGGEEFAVFLDEADDERAQLFAEDLREGLSQLHLQLDLPQGATSASIGITHHTRGETIAASLQRADAAMYDAKTEGRNRVRREDR